MHWYSPTDLRDCLAGEGEGDVTLTAGTDTGDSDELSAEHLRLLSALTLLVLFVTLVVPELVLASLTSAQQYNIIIINKTLGTFKEGIVEVCRIS